MSVVAAKLVEATTELSEHVISHAKMVLAGFLVPRVVSGEVVRKYIWKAMRLGVWRVLKPESRALLLALRRWGVVKSPTLKSILLNIFLEIELCTVRGKALFYGIILTMRNFMGKAISIAKDIGKILYIGISYLNNPPMYRIYG